ncbi:MAG: hypothetical protein AAGA11_02855 [Pseudomonadota bacterium]
MIAETPPPERNTLTNPGAWPLLLGLGCVRLLGALPERWWHRISHTLGGVLWRLAGSRRRVVDTNLAIALPEMCEPARADLSRVCFERLVLSLIEVGKLWFGPASFASARVELRGLDRVREVNRTHAVLLTAPHWFTVEVVGVAIARAVPLSAVYARAKNPHFERFEVAKRMRFLVSLIERQQTVRMVRALRGKQIIWWLPDQAVGASRGAVESRFFGRTVLSSRATAWFLAREAVKVMPVSVVRSESGRIVATIGEPLDDLVGDDAEVTAQLDAHFEREIRRQPSEYFWMHRRFKPVRPGGDDPYKRSN